MRVRTALYGRKHVAQVVAIKRLQTTGKSLAEIQALWPTLDDATLSRMAGVELATKSRTTRKDFWKAAPAPAPSRPVPPPVPQASDAELRVELAPNVSLSIALSDDAAISMADVAAIRAAAAPLIAELARRRIAMHADEGEIV